MAPYTALLLSDIFNKCALDVVFPLSLKIAKVTPIFKNGSKVKASISVLSPFSKIFEKIIYNQFNKYFPKNDMISKEQFGFRAEHSTSHGIADVVNKLEISRDNYNVWGAAWLHPRTSYVFNIRHANVHLNS